MSIRSREKAAFKRDEQKKSSDKDKCEAAIFWVNKARDYSFGKYYSYSFFNQESFANFGGLPSGLIRGDLAAVQITKSETLSGLSSKT